ncbi:hypothetical protein N0V93_003319 [Gnomoniopsis smithogilvyi]|uniref:J domain-containing protein n=1 Tax=Gnomoniopsis smithogilvyi TaxID=1191159 RepID=A0A9W8Z079_9PEZI|nr:hypothetical protein N0V93_003319 [Gnomoniopsis smithogilvyi]
MERGTHNPRRPGSAARTRSRNPSRSTASSARSSGVFVDRDATPLGGSAESSSSYLYPNRFNPSLRSVGSRVSLSEQFATTRKEYEFGFDDAISFVAQSEYEDEEEEDITVDDDTLTTLGNSDGAVVVPPVIEGRENAEDNVQTVVSRIRRTHYELLCLPEEGIITADDIRRAYFRLYAVLHSTRLPSSYREAAQGYFADVQVAFETLITKASKEEYDFTVVDEDNETTTEDERGAYEDDKITPNKKANPRFVRRLRRQQEQGVTELGVQMDAQPLISQNRNALRHRQVLPAGLCLTQTFTTGFPAVSRFIQPRVRRIYQALKPPAELEDIREGEVSEIYCTPPTVTLASSVFATNSRSAWLPPATVLSQQQNIIPDVFPKDRPLQWYSTYLSPLLNLKLRQELFLRETGLSEVTLKRTLPDAVVELETDTMNAVSVTARASHTVCFEREEHTGVDDLVQVEASVSVNRSWLARSYATRLGLAAYKKLSPSGGIVFACADTGTSSLWEQSSPVAFWDSQPPENDSTAASWRTYMDSLAKSLGQGLMPYYYSPPTVEVGYRFSDSSNEHMGLPSGRPFTKQARSGLRRLHDDVDLVGAGACGSWTISGAVTSGGVAGYLRYGRDLFTSRSSSTQLEVSSRSSSKWAERLGFRMEAELTTQKMKNDLVFSGLQWGKSEICHLAVRGIKKIGKSSKVGLELGVVSASNSVVLSVYLSPRNNQRFILPIMLFRDSPLMNQRFSTSCTKMLFWTAVVPALGLAAVDYITSRTPAETSNPKSKKKAKRTRDYLQRRVTQCRAEADDIVAMLVQPVLHRQRLQRADGGLVILDARYGVLLDTASASSTTPNWAAPEDVADVTVAMAALVDDEGKLRIPEGLRKSKLMGFWDPNPGSTKWLVVRYVYGGREATKAVAGRKELRLP